MVFYLSIILGKLVALLSYILKIGAGSTWPGHLALIFDKNFLKKFFKKNPHLQTILVTGTNGKTTTVALLKYLLEKKGYQVFTNKEGANLLNGIASSLIKNANFLGKIEKQVAIFEADEFNFPLIIKEFSPNIVLILNLFRDQLDRYGEVNTIASRWLLALKNLSPKTLVFLNGDDPNLYYLGKNISSFVFYFGLEKSKMPYKNLPFDVDFNYCPVCFNLLSYQKVAYSHLGSFFCQKCGFHQENIFTLSLKNIPFSLFGIYNQYNLTAAFLVLIKGFNFDLSEIFDFVKDFKPAFGRQEKIIYKNRVFYLLLSKNPAGFNQSIEAVTSYFKGQKKFFWLILNNRIPDGRDVSWIFDVEFKKIVFLAKKIFVSGDRAFDMAIRLKYELPNSKKKIIPLIDLKKTLKKILEETKENEAIFVFPNYSAMLEVRKLLVGKKFL